MANYYVKPPIPNWREVLQDWRTYITNPVEWGPFAEYTGAIADFLFYHYPRAQHLNSRFKDRLTGFGQDELHILRDVLKRMGDAQERLTRVQLTQDEGVLFHQAQETIGDLQVGGTPFADEPWSIGSVILPSA